MKKIKVIMSFILFFIVPVMAATPKLHTENEVAFYKPRSTNQGLSEAQCRQQGQGFGIFSKNDIPQFRKDHRFSNYKHIARNVIIKIAADGKTRLTRTKLSLDTMDEMVPVNGQNKKVTAIVSSYCSPLGCEGILANKYCTWNYVARAVLK